MSKFKNITHGVALAVAAVGAWYLTPQGQGIINAVIHAYPKLSALTGMLGFLASLYHSPKA